MTEEDERKHNAINLAHAEAFLAKLEERVDDHYAQHASSLEEIHGRVAAIESLFDGLVVVEERVAVIEALLEWLDPDRLLERVARLEEELERSTRWARDAQDTMCNSLTSTTERVARLERRLDPVERDWMNRVDADPTGEREDEPQPPGDLD